MVLLQGVLSFRCQGLKLGLICLMLRLDLLQVVVRFQWLAGLGCLDVRSSAGVVGLWFPNNQFPVYGVRCGCLEKCRQFLRRCILCANGFQ